MEDYKIIFRVEKIAFEDNSILTRTFGSFFKLFEVVQSSPIFGYGLGEPGESQNYNLYDLNINYFDSICEKYGLKKIVNSGFENLFSQIPEKDYGKAKSMSANLKTYSFLNNYFVYEKV